MSGPTWRSHEPKFRETEANWAIFPLCAAPFSLCAALLWGLFWGTCRYPKCSQVSLLEILSYLLSNPTVIFEFGAHLPLQIFILPRLLPVCQKSGRKSFFACFLTFWRLKTWWNFLAIDEKVYICIKNPKILSFLEKELPIERVTRGARCVGGENLF